MVDVNSRLKLAIIHNAHRGLGAGGVRRDETLIELVVNTIENVQKNPFQSNLFIKGVRGNFYTINNSLYYYLYRNSRVHPLYFISI